MIFYSRFSEQKCDADPDADPVSTCGCYRIPHKFQLLTRPLAANSRQVFLSVNYKKNTKCMLRTGSYCRNKVFCHRLVIF
jgi:hypothetical protein